MLGSYKHLLNSFILNGYEFIFFDELDTKKGGQVILRHDIDFCCKSALDMAEIENSLGVNSTYFFLLTNASYNLISKENLDILEKINEFGHKISLHYDPSIYENQQTSLNKEIETFEKFTGNSVDIISLHRPSKRYLNLQNTKYFDVSNTYDDKYFKETKYFADSRAEFRYGHPIESKEFKSRKNIQLLIHPIWWIDSNNKSKHECMDIVYDRKCTEIKEHFKNSVKFYNG